MFQKLTVCFMFAGLVMTSSYAAEASSCSSALKQAQLSCRKDKNCVKVAVSATKTFAKGIKGCFKVFKELGSCRKAKRSSKSECRKDKRGCKRKCRKGIRGIKCRASCRKAKRRCAAAARKVKRACRREAIHSRSAKNCKNASLLTGKILGSLAKKAGKHFKAVAICVAKQGN
ncbi:MAG: hypothetical protein EP343_16900 [Deltaproteobacteria bacterium]|nr:MAG: hypothetical protein EP343_16900 [Deltaproteobacteria bacterium]